MKLSIGFITSNTGKLLELQTKLIPIGYDIIQLQIEYPEMQTDTIDEVSKFGLEWIIDQHDRGNIDIIIQKEIKDLDFLIVEDSGLFVHALNNFPGVYSKFVFKSIGYSGILKLLLDVNDRSAHFESCFGLIKLENSSLTKEKKKVINNTQTNDITLFKGIVEGEIVNEPRGENGFGYDPIFKPIGSTKTFAEMDTELKNAYSHRGKAIQKVIAFLD